MTTNLVRATLLGAAALACAPASATAARTFHATPRGIGDFCSSINPCQLQTAADAAQSGDTIVIHAGTHRLHQGGGVLGRSLSWEKAPGEARPTVELTADGSGCGIALTAEGEVRDLRLRPQNPDMWAICAFEDGALIERVAISGPIATSQGGIAVSTAGYVIIRDTSINLPFIGGVGISFRGAKGRLQNVSVRGAERALVVGPLGASDASAIVRSSYLSSGTAAIALDCSGTTPERAIARVANSALGSVENSGCTYEEQTANLTAAGAGVETDDEGVLRLTPGSPLIDAGATDDRTGRRDVDLQPRVLGTQVDIGADELPRAPQEPTTSLRDVTHDGVTATALTFGWGARTMTAEFLAAPAAGGATAIVEAPVEIGDGGGPISFPTATARLTGLRPATVYKLRARITNEFGQQVVGPLQTFTTALTTPDAPQIDLGGVGDRASGENPATVLDTTRAVDPPRAGDRTAPSCAIAIARGRRFGRVVVRGRCSEPTRLVLRVARRGRRAQLVTLRVGGGRRFVRSVRLGRLATVGRRLQLTVRDTAGNTATPRTLAIGSAR